MRPIEPEELGWTLIQGRPYVVNTRPGVPFNACIEEYDGRLRCWASHAELTAEAARLVESFASPSPTGAFVWRETVPRGVYLGMRGGREVFAPFRRRERPSARSERS